MFCSIGSAEFLCVLLTFYADFFKIVGKAIRVYSIYDHFLDRNIFLKHTLTLYSTKADIHMLPPLQENGGGKKKDYFQSGSKVIKLILRVNCWYTKNMQPWYEISILLLGH